MRLRAGSWPWLLFHEMRLAWRGWSDNIGIIAAVAILLWLIFHIPAFRIMRSVSLTALESGGIQIAGLVFWFGLTLMLSTAVILAVNALHDRGDLDLLVSSPLPTTTIFAVRGAGVALNAVALFALLLLPLAHMGVLRGQTGLVAVYPVLAGIGLGVAGLAFALTLLLVRWFGARRARVIAQVLGALIGALLFLLFQIPNLMSDEAQARLTERLIAAAGSDWFAADSVLWWPVRALFGDPLPMLATIAAGAAIFVVVIRATSRTFVAGTQESVTARPRRAGPKRAARFEQGLARNVMQKELRLILRDPNLIAKTLLQSLYLVPMILILARNAGLMLVIAPAIIMLLAGMAGNLAWITISGEEAPDLVGSAPVDREKVRWLKAAAALRPLAFIALPFLLFYVVRSPGLALIFLVFLALALAASAVIQVFGGKPSPQRDLKQRQKQSVGLNFLEVLGTIAFAGACYLTMTASWWALAAAPVGLLPPAVAWALRRRDGV